MPLTIWQIDSAQMTPFYNIALCDALTQADCEVRYIASRYLYTALDYPPSFQHEDLYFRGIDGDWLLKFPQLRKLLRGLYYPFNTLWLWQKIRSHKPDIVHFQWSRLPRFDSRLIQAIQGMGIPVVHTVHDVTPLYERGSVANLYALYHQCDVLIVHSEANKQALLAEVEAIQPEKVHILPLVNAPFPQPADASQAKAREQLGIAPDAFVLLFFGLVKHYKGIDILLETIKQVNQVSDKITWLVVGKADEASQQAYLEQIKTQARTIVVSDYIPNEQMWLYHRAADIAIFPYRHIFQSAALITAMSFGLPIIATDVGSFPETVKNNGVLVPKENPEALKAAVLEAFKHWDVKAMGQESLRIIQHVHEGRAVGQALRGIYEKIINPVS